MENLICQVCNGALNLLGILGNREHYNCQQCGAEFSYDLTRVKFNFAKKKNNDK
jgi:predicted amidophosphoribosyltransferase